MFDTIINNVKGKIDEKVRVGDNVQLKGWAFNEAMGVCPIRVKYLSTIKAVDIESRPDVVSEFKRNNIILCGWKVSVPVGKYCDLQMKIGGEWLTFLSFDTLFPNKVAPVAPEAPVAPVPPEVSVAPVKNVIIPNSTAKQDTPELTPNFILSDLYVRDNFYTDPSEIRKQALTGSLSVQAQIETKDMLEVLLGQKISIIQGGFQNNIAGDKLTVEYKKDLFCAYIFLTPYAPSIGGITFYKSRRTNKMLVADNEINIVFQNGNLDCTEFDPIDTIGNKFNRVVIFNARLLHSATKYFGNNVENGRLVQVMTFGMEDTPNKNTTTKISLNM